MASLSSGSTSANTSSTPRSAPTASATWRASPVIITTCRPMRLELGDRVAGLGPDLVLERQTADDRRRRGRGRAPLRRGPSSRATTPAELGRLARATAPAAAPARRRRSASPSTVASTPRPVIDRNVGGGGDPAALGARPRRWPGPAGARCRTRPPPARRSTSSSVEPVAGDADDGVLALGQGAGLVEQERRRRCGSAPGRGGP